MNHTPQIKTAIQFAARKHHGQMRREAEPLPYVTHLFSVALLVAQDGAEDDVVCAALLHDTLEDTETTRDELVRAFGERVAALVEHVSEKKTEHGQPVAWKKRKSRYLQHLQEAPADALRIAIADKIDNVESKLEAFEKEGPAFFERWSQPPAAYVWYHGEALRIAEKRLPDDPLTRRLAEAHGKEHALLAG